MRTKKILTIRTTDWHGEIAEKERQGTIKMVENFLILLKVDFQKNWLDIIKTQFVLDIDDYEYMLILQCLRLSDLHFDFE